MSTETRHFATPLSHLALFHQLAEQLSERQRRALSSLAAGRSITAASAEAGVHRSSLHSWLARDPAFRDAYAALSRHQAESAADLATIARAALQALLTDPAAPYDIRLRAIQTALKAVQSAAAFGLFPALAPPATPAPAGVSEPRATPTPAPVSEPRALASGPSADPAAAQARDAARLAERQAMRDLHRRICADLDRDTPTAPAPGPTPPTGAARGARMLGVRRETGGGVLGCTSSTPSERNNADVPLPQATQQATPRSAPCPCGSGLKFKRCCGKSAPPVLHTAA